MIWFLKDAARVEQERRAIAGLAESAPWLSGVAWRLDERLRLCVDADILIDEIVFPITLRYPEFYPHTPPSVWPRGNVGERWSEHQYGAGGELCLEYGPDNWVPELTGAGLLVSAHRLLVGEQGGGDAPRELVASRHQTTLGQDLRSSRFRFVVTSGLAAFVQTLPSGTLIPLTTRWVRQARSCMAVVGKARPATGPEWIDLDVPPDLGVAVEGVLVRLPAAANGPPIKSFAALCATLGKSGIDLEAWSADQEAPPELFVLAWEDHLEVWWRWESPKDSVVRFETVIVSDVGRARLSAGFQALADKAVAIVGCGSAGAKIAVSLARCGVGRFVLVDDDILLPQNLVRNELDWRDIGSHKADALAARLRLVNSRVVTEPRRVRLSAQEASGTAAAALHAIAHCDLIVDATANPSAFNILVSIVAAAEKPLVWLEVFGGGYGGLVARHRPGVDPTPQSMRAGILDWCSRRNRSWPTIADPYEAGDDEGVPLVADDAAVSVIAANAAQLAIDQLLRETPSRFPHAIYLVGLGRGWIFGQAFESFPIDIERPTMEQKNQGDAEDAQAGIAFVEALVRRLRDDSSRSP